MTFGPDESMSRFGDSDKNQSALDTFAKREERALHLSVKRAGLSVGKHFPEQL